ncbi:alpha-1-antitrypsin-related protein-like [Lepus europaeus]|uniref:alpha-1-antitrypsin-related protein-like n=1 Tax=Lepus europaeus TaxID=9983 RepID=UPI002B46FDF6|nr:alpha-1-antitrypsin-related protein-like [Lepus europaeus]
MVLVQVRDIITVTGQDAVRPLSYPGVGHRPVKANAGVSGAAQGVDSGPAVAVRFRLCLYLARCPRASPTLWALLPRQPGQHSGVSTGRVCGRQRVQVPESQGGAGTMLSSSSQRPLLLAVLCCLLSGPEATGAQQSEESKPTQEHPTHSEPPVCQSIFNNIADIFLCLYKESARFSKSSNIVFSPLSITAALATLLLGTKADSHSQIWNGLEFNLLGTGERLVHTCFQQLLRTFQHWDNELAAGSVLFIDESLQPRAEFVEGVEQLSHSEAVTVNLRDTHGARAQINSFLRRETKNEITDLVQDLEDDTRLALLTYISFHGKLRDEFHAELTVEENFHVDERTTVTVPTVNRLGAFDLHRDTNFSSWVLAQHCLGDAVAYYVLPDKGKMEQLERGLTQEQLDGLLRPSDIRFSISGTHDLKHLLGKLGITRVFSDEADFSGITEQAPLKLSQATHRAVLTLDDDAFSERMYFDVGPWPSLPTFKFNRPFLVIVKDDNNNFPVFMGKVVNPSQG